jgi:isoquinoline 1-oxidoreductase beta subunit
MEVLNCTANVSDNSCELWVPTQAAEWCIGTAMAVTGLPANRITVNTTYLGGGFGRKIEQDYVTQAVMLSKSVRRPVKLMWSREQDFKNDRYRPASAMRVRLGADANGTIKSFIFRNVSTSINVQRGTTPGNNPEDTGAVAGAAHLPYKMQSRRVEFVHNDSDLPLGYWRSVGESYNTFAVECAIDEMAQSLGKDPMAYRKTLLADDARASAVLNELSALSNWSSRLPKGTARGMAFLKGFFSYVAAVAEIRLIGGKISVSKFYCVLDCGTVINPDSVKAQIEGGILHGMSAALWHRITFSKGKASVSNFDRYRVAKMADVPDISIRIINSQEAPGGVGELGVPCVAPAIANAHSKLASRIRNLPFHPGQGLDEIEDDGDGGDD